MAEGVLYRDLHTGAVLERPAGVPSEHVWTRRTTAGVRGSLLMVSAEVSRDIGTGVDVDVDLRL
jgi:hypothetical protein